MGELESRDQWREAVNFAGLGGALIAGLAGKREEEQRLRQQRIDDEDREISRKAKGLGIAQQEAALAEIKATRAAKAQALRGILAAKNGMDVAIPSMQFNYGENDEDRTIPPRPMAPAPAAMPLAKPRNLGLGKVAADVPDAVQVATNVPEAEQLAILPGQAAPAPQNGAGAPAAAPGVQGGGGGLAVGAGALRGRSAKGDTVASASGLGAHGEALLGAQNALKAKYAALEAAVAAAEGNPDRDAVLAALYDQHKGEIETLQSAIAKGAGEVSQARMMAMARTALGMVLQDGDSERALRFVDRNGGMPGTEIWRGAQVVRKQVPDLYGGTRTEAWIAIGSPDGSGNRTLVPLPAFMGSVLNLSDKELVELFSKIDMEGQKLYAKTKTSDILAKARVAAAHIQAFRPYESEKIAARIEPLLAKMNNGGTLTPAERAIYDSTVLASNGSRFLVTEAAVGSASGQEKRKRELRQCVLSAERNLASAAATGDPDAISLAKANLVGFQQALWNAENKPVPQPKPVTPEQVRQETGKRLLAEDRAKAKAEGDRQRGLAKAPGKKPVGPQD